MAKRSAFGLLLKSYTNSPSCYTKTGKFRDRVSPAIVLLSSSAAAFLPLLPSGRPTGGGSNQEAAQVTISGGLLSSTHAFVVFIMFAFSSAFSAMFLDRKLPQAARVFRFSAMMWLFSAIVMLVHAIFCDRLS